MGLEAVDINHIRSICKDCSVSELCLPRGLKREEVEQLEGLVGWRGPLAAREHLFRLGQACQALFAIKSGLVKTVTYTAEGSEQVTGFFMGGDLLGFDGLADDVHVCSALALDTTSVCVLPIDQLDQAATASSGLHRQLRRLLARELSHEEILMRSLREQASEARLIAFLLRLSERYEERNLNGHCFALKIPIKDLSNYLNLRPETTSRHLTQLNREGLIHLQPKGRVIRLLHPERMRDQVPGYREEFQIHSWKGYDPG